MFPQSLGVKYFKIQIKVYKIDHSWYRQNWNDLKLSLGEYSTCHLFNHFYLCIRPIIHTRIKYKYQPNIRICKMNDKQ